METEQDKPVDREAWRRLLEDGGEPPALTDARIRAKARQALTPRTQRWWLPASLAASLLLAVLIVQWQYERPRVPLVVSESDYAAAPAETPAPQRRDESPAMSITTASPRQRAAEAGTDAARQGGFVASPPPVVQPPQVDLPASEGPTTAITARVGEQAPRVQTRAPPAEAAAAESSADAALAAEAKRKEDLGEVVVTGNRQQQGNLESTTPVTQVTSADVSGRRVANSGALMKSKEAVRTPEEWYADIEKLRAAGKKREARRELEKLEEAYPGWLEKNYPPHR